MPRKKKKEGVIKKPKKLQKIEVIFEPGKMVFKVGDTALFMDENTAVSLFGRSGGVSIEEQFRQARGEDSDFSKFENYEFLARFIAAKRHFSTLDQAARFLKVDALRLKRWIALRQKWIKIESGNSFVQDEAKRIEEKYFPAETMEEEQGPSHGLPVKKIAKLMNEGKDLRAIASELGIRWEDFIKRYTQNIKEVNRILREIAAKNEEPPPYPRLG